MKKYNPKEIETSKKLLSLRKTPRKRSFTRLSNFLIRPGPVFMSGTRGRSRLWTWSRANGVWMVIMFCIRSGSTLLACPPKITPSRPAGLPPKRPKKTSLLLRANSNYSAIASIGHGLLIQPILNIINGRNGFFCNFLNMG